LSDLPKITIAAKIGTTFRKPPFGTLMKRISSMCRMLLATCSLMLMLGLPYSSFGTASGTNRVLIVSATFKTRSTPETQSNLQKSYITNAGAFFYTSSYGDCAIAPLGASGSKFIAVTLPEIRSFYLDQANYPGYMSGSRKLRRDVFDKVVAAGTDPTDYDFKAICFEDCSTAEPEWYYWGLSLSSETVGGTFYPAATLFNGHFSANVCTHEFGHGMTLDHAGCWMSKTSNPIDTGSNVDKKSYGDRFDMMGNCSVQYSGIGWGGGIEHYNIFYKQKLGWIRSQDWTNVPASSSATYRLYANDMFDARGGNRLLAIKVLKPSISGRSYWLGHRQLFDNQWLTNGVQIHFQENGIISDPGGQADTGLIDVTPLSDTRYVGSNGDFKQDPEMNDSALVIGRTFSDSTDNIHITPIGRGYQTITGSDINWIDVVVNRDITGNSAPSVNFSGNPTNGTVNEPLTFTANASDPNGDTLAYYWDFSSDGGATWNTNFQSTNSAVKIKSWSSTGTQYRVRVTVSDRKGAVAKATNNVAIINGATPPIVVTQPASQTVAVGQSATFTVVAYPTSGVTYQWRKSTNNIGGATGASYNIPAVQAADAGNYSVVVSDAWHSVTSSIAVLTVTAAIGQWTFNSVPPDNDTATGTTAPTIGSGIVSLGGSGMSPNGYNDGSPSDPAATDNSGRAWQGPSSSSTANKTGGPQFFVSTVGYQHIVVTWDMWVGGRASAYWRGQYSTNGGTNWTDRILVNRRASWPQIGTDYATYSDDLNGLTGVMNNPNFAYRVVGEYESTATGSGSATYVPAESTQIYNNTGPFRFDMVTVSGDAIPMGGLVFAPGGGAGATISWNAINGPTIRWKATSGKKYEVQYKTNLNDSYWRVLAEVTAENDSVLTTDNPPANEGQRFYRIVPQ
jgi:hypothetical protein